ncbi:MAG TPA: tetratricopeptide repeat protein [Caulobacteraceae bacterium]|jgi:tetratricopeptide (TPR) repeat protein|nr:tetratricopeptide repeat protein [Caulobacteraceae bacterium]
MRRLSRLASLSVAAALAACATQPASPPQPPIATAGAPEPNASAYGLFLAGHAARDAGQLGPAAAYLGQAAATAGEPGYVRTEAFEAVLRSGDVSGAAALSPAADDPNLAARRLGVLVRGVEAMALGRNKDAYALLSGPDIGFPHKSLARLLAPFAAGAAGDSAHAVAKPDVDADPVAQFVGALDRALLLERLGRFSDADIAYKALLEPGDESGLVTVAYGRYLERRGRWADAVKLYRGRLAQAPADSPIAEALARAAKRGRPPAAPGFREGASAAILIPAASLIGQKQDGIGLDYLRLALRLDPHNSEAWILVGDILSGPDPAAARQAYAQVQAGAERYVVAQGKLAWSYQNAGDHEAALKVARGALAGQPASREAAATLADLLRANDQYSESAAVLTHLIDVAGPAPDWRLYYLRASAYEQMDDVEKTEADLQAALKLAPDEPELLNFQAYFWIDRGEHLRDALAMVQRAVAANPQSGEMLDSLGWAYYRLGDYRQAVIQLEAAITLDPGIAEVNDHLGDAYWRVGRKIEAQFQWRRALSLNPTTKLRTRAEAKLASPDGPDAPTAPMPSTIAQ